MSQENVFHGIPIRTDVPWRHKLFHWRWRVQRSEDGTLHFCHACSKRGMLLVREWQAAPSSDHYSGGGYNGPMEYIGPPDLRGPERNHIDFWRPR